jgi:hypothetical protein
MMRFMLIAVLRVGSPRFDVDAFLAAHPSIEPDSVWHVGEPRVIRRFRDTSGFNLSAAAEAPTWRELVERSPAFLEGIRPMLIAARELGLVPQLDFGIDVGTEKAFTRSCAFSPEHIRALAEFGVEVCVSAYPTRRH